MKKKYLIAYAQDRALPMITAEDCLHLTHINLSFAIPRSGVLSLENFEHLDELDRIRSYNKELKVVLSIGGAMVGGFSTLARTAAGRERFAVSVAEAVERLGLDGADLDWEFPCNGWLEGADDSPEDKENFTLLLQQMRHALGSGKILSIAAGAMPRFVEDTQMDQAAAVLDYVQIMTYDMRPGCFYTGHHASLFPSRDDPWGDSTQQAVKRFFKAGVPLDKIVIGAAFYGRKWVGGAAGQGLVRRADSMGDFAGIYDTIRQYEQEGDWQVCWDEAAQANYMLRGDQFISYESARAIRLKCRYVLEQNLAGIMYWEHSYDTSHDLLKMMAEELYGQQ